VSSINKTDHHNITVVLLKVALNTINQTNKTSLAEIDIETKKNQHINKQKRKKTTTTSSQGDIQLSIITQIT
jgi:hypothetical protein